MGFSKPPGVPCPPKNPHCNGEEPAQFSIALTDVVRTWQNSTKEDLLMGFAVLLVIVLLLKMLNELTRKKDMQNTKTKL